MTFTSKSERETKKFAARLVRKYQEKLEKKCLILALEGELGAGKTVFAKGVAQALGIKKVIRSPSFIIEREFPYRLGKISGKFFHIDLWRMESEKEIKNLNFERHFQPGNVIVIEWSEKIKKFLGQLKKRLTIEVVLIRLSYVDEKTREIEIK